MTPGGPRVEADLTFEVEDGRGRATSGTARTDRSGDGRVQVDVDDPVAFFAALPARLERSAVDRAGELLDPAPVVEVTSGGYSLAVVDPAGRSALGRLLGDERLHVSARGALAVARGRAPDRQVAAAAAALLLVLMLAKGRRSGR